MRRFAVTLLLAVPLPAQAPPLTREGPLAPGDAAVAYRSIAAALRKRFGQDVVLPETEYDTSALGMTAAEATRDDWRQAVKAAEPELVAFAAAIAEPRCHFRPTSADPMLPEFIKDLLVPLLHLQSLNVAAALQAIADGKPERLERACTCALGLARHLQQQPSALSWSFAAQIEHQALALLASAGPLGAEVTARLRATVALHLARRPGVAAAAVAARIETERLFDGMLEQLQRGKDIKAQVARQFGTAVRRAFFAEVSPILDGYAALPDVPDAREAALQQLIAGLVERQRARRQQIEALAAEGSTGQLAEHAADDLALMLATLLLPQLDQLRRAQIDVLQQLRAAAR